MKKRFVAFSLLLFPLAFMLQGHTIAGGDHYRIFLNDKKVVEHFVLNKLPKTSLDLSNVKQDDKLIIHYSHCGKVGSSRRISVRDNKGVVIKEWKFPDSKQTGMQLTVKEVMKYISNKNPASLHYASRELNPGMELTQITIDHAVTALR